MSVPTNIPVAESDREGLFGKFLNAIASLFRTPTNSISTAMIKTYHSLSAILADLLGIRFYEDVAECHSKHRVGAVFSFGKTPPTERKIIVFDDFVTSGATMISMRELLMPLGKKTRVLYRNKQQAIIIIFKSPLKILR